MNLPEGLRRSLDDLAFLVLRLAVGAVFFMHGCQKMFGAFGGGGIPGAVAAAANAGFQPAELWGVVLAITEFAGSLALLLGLGTRIAAAFLAFEMAVAIVQVHLPMGFFNSRGGFEFPLTLLAASLALVLGGPGRLSLDHVFVRRRDEPASPLPG